MKIKNKKELIEKLNTGYSVCSECVIDNEGKPSGGVHTNFVSKCTICEKEKGCGAVTDYIWPKSFKIGFVWD